MAVCVLPMPPRPLTAAVPFEVSAACNCSNTFSRPVKNGLRGYGTFQSLPGSVPPRIGEATEGSGSYLEPVAIGVFHNPPAPRPNLEAQTSDHLEVKASEESVRLAD